MRHLTRVVFCLSFLIIPLQGHSNTIQETKKKINLIQKYINKNYSQNFENLKSWQAARFKNEMPAFDVKFKKSLRFLEKYYKDLSAQKNLLRPTTQKTVFQRARWYSMVNTKIRERDLAKRRPEKIQVERPTIQRPVIESQDIVSTNEEISNPDIFSVNYIMFQDLINLQGAGLEEQIATNFSGFAFGLSHKFLWGKTIFQLQGDVFVANSDLESTKLEYAQESAVIMGGIASPRLGMFLSDGIFIYAGAAIGFRTLRTAKAEGVKAELASSTFIAPEFGTEIDVSKSLSFNAGLLYLNSTAGGKVGLGYKF